MRACRIANFVKFQIGHHARATPQTREEKHSGYTGQHKRPPLPVTRHAVLAHLLGNPVGSIAAEGGGHHRQPRKPPRHRPARGKKLGRAFTRFLPHKQRGNETDQQRSCDDDPVNGVNLHEAVPVKLLLNTLTTDYTDKKDTFAMIRVIRGLIPLLRNCLRPPLAVQAG